LSIQRVKTEQKNNPKTTLTQPHTSLTYFLIPQHSQISKTTYLF